MQFRSILFYLSFFVIRHGWPLPIDTAQGLVREEALLSFSYNFLAFGMPIRTI